MICESISSFIITSQKLPLFLKGGAFLNLVPLSLLNKYYQILGLSPGAPKSVVKKTYWKLAKKYHPDVNPSKNANVKFLEITSAYEAIVEGKIPKEVTIQPTSASFTPQDPFEKYKDVYQPPKDPVEYAEWIKVAKKRAEDISQKQYRVLQGYIQYLDGVRRMFFYPSIFTGVLALLLIFDNFMPLEKEVTKVEEVSKNGMVYLRNGDSFRGGRESEYLLNDDIPVMLVKSPWFDVVQAYGVESNQGIALYELREHFYLWGGFYNYLLLGFSIVMLFRIKFITGNFFAFYFIVLFWGLIQWWWY